MITYNCMKAMVPKIEDGSKIHTFRANGKRRHAATGDKIRLYTGMRQPGCRLVREAVCIGSWPCHLPVSPKYGPLVWSINGRVLSHEQMNAFAVNDGFVDCVDMAGWLLDTHGEDATGTLIVWQWANYLPMEDD
jgi:hypothetical protein